MLTDASFAENLGIFIGGLTSLIVAVGGVAVVRGRKEAREGEGPSQLAVLKKSIDENTAAKDRQTFVLQHMANKVDAMVVHTSNIDRNSRDTLGVTRGIERSMIKLEDRR